MKAHLNSSDAYEYYYVRKLGEDFDTAGRCASVGRRESSVMVEANTWPLWAKSTYCHSYAQLSVRTWRRAFTLLDRASALGPWGEVEGQHLPLGA